MLPKLQYRHDEGGVVEAGGKVIQKPKYRPTNPPRPRHRPEVGGARAFAPRLASEAVGVDVLAVHVHEPTPPDMLVADAGEGPEEDEHGLWVPGLADRVQPSDQCQELTWLHCVALW